MRLFLIAAVVLAVFTIIAGARADQVFWVTSYGVWLAATILAYLTDLLLGDVLIGYTGRRRTPPPA